MKLINIKASGLSLFKDDINIDFYASQRVNEDDKDALYELSNNIFLNKVNVFTGVNASGKTCSLYLIKFVIDLLNNQSINHSRTKNILGNDKEINLEVTYCYDKKEVFLLKSTITSNEDENGEVTYSIKDEEIYSKKMPSVKKNLLCFDKKNLKEKRNNNEQYLPNDVSITIKYNREHNNQELVVWSLLQLTNENRLLMIKDIPSEIITFLDPTIEYLKMDSNENKVMFKLRFKKDKKDIIIHNSNELFNYLSSGTIKGITHFYIAKQVIKQGGYLLVDEIENHFNKEIVSTFIKLFMDKDINHNGGVLIFSTHYPEILDIFDRNDNINITRNDGNISIENLSAILTRNDIKKSDAYQSGLIGGTTPKYNDYLALKKSMME